VTNLPAGAELDRLVCEKVMGKTYRQMTGFQMQYEGMLPWSPSTNIAHAWEVVEHLQAHNPFWQGGDGMGGDSWGSVTISPCSAYRPEGWHGWTVNFGDDNTSASGETLPLAICRAALAAVSE